MTFNPQPKPSAKAKSPRAMKAKPKTLRVSRAPAVAIKVGDKVSGAIVGTVIAVNGQTKAAMIQAMLRTPEGATSKQLEMATGWAPHSVRGYLGTLRKAKVRVTSTKLPKQPTVYRIEDAADEVL